MIPKCNPLPLTTTPGLMTTSTPVRNVLWFDALVLPGAMTLKPVVVVVLTAQVKRNWLGCVTTHAANAPCGATRTNVPTLLINASDPTSRHVLIVSSLKPAP
jgi:hypothetical protein